MKSPLSKTEVSPLDLVERIEKLHADIEAYIDAKVEAEAKDLRGAIPAVRLKHDLWVRGAWCHCAVLKQNKP
jgi:hypothetical protein